jgi:hypothetical protein
VKLVLLNLAWQFFLDYILWQEFIFSDDLLYLLHQAFLRLPLGLRIEVFDEPKISDIQNGPFGVSLWGEQHESNKLEH